MAVEGFVKLVQGIYRTNEFIPLHIPRFSQKEKDYVNSTIDSTFVSSVGSYVNDVEDYVAKFTGAEKAVAVVNGTAAIQVALRMVGVEKDTEVLTQSLTFVATANAILYNHASPIFIDVDRDTMGLSPDSLSTFLQEFGERRENATHNKKSGKRIAACLPMHTFGFMCRIEEIKTICDDWNIPLVEDAAEAMGSFYLDGRSAGTIGQVGAFSYNGNKIITSGGGGMLVTTNEQTGVLAKHLTTTAKKPHKWEYFHDHMGYNFRMPNLNAALLLAQLESLEKFRDSKEQVYREYMEFFKNSDIKLVEVPETTSQWNHWLISVQLDSLKDRNEFLEATNSQGIMTRPIWTLMWELPMFEGCQKDNQLNSKYLAERIVNIPSSARL